MSVWSYCCFDLTGVSSTSPIEYAACALPAREETKDNRTQLLSRMDTAWLRRMRTGGGEGCRRRRVAESQLCHTSDVYFGDFPARLSAAVGRWESQWAEP